MLLKIAIITLLLSILYCLGSSLVYFVRDGNLNLRMMRRLTWRVILSFAVFCLVLISVWFGWLVPNTIT